MNIQSINAELRFYLEGLVQEEYLTDDNVEDWQRIAFNEDPYIIGYDSAEGWLKHHQTTPFEAIEQCIQYERDTLGEVNKDYGDSEVTVNMLVYILGEQLLAELNAQSIDELKEALS